MKKLLLLFLLIIFNRCHFFFPSSYIDNDEISYKKISDDFFLSKSLNQYDLLEKINDDEVYETILSSIDSIYYETNNEIYLFSDNQYYLLINKKIIKIVRVDKKMSSVENFMFK